MHNFIRRAAIFCLALALCLSMPAPACAEKAHLMLGADVSELLSQEASGVIYHDFDGNPRDALEILAENGVDHIRLRVWNDPFDAEGHGYGAGNIDASAAATLSARAAALGMKTLLDFHYSDFWADPSRQIVPKAWAGMSLTEKEAALKAYTLDALNQVLDAGGDVDMVQVGNEVNYGMAGEYDLQAYARLIAAGCEAVRECAQARNIDIRVCVHLTDPQNPDGLETILRAFTDAGAVFDTVGLSYYPYWHGELPGIVQAITRLRQDFGVDVFIAENSWPFTLEEGDFAGDVVNYEPGLYPATPEGQAQEVADVCGAAAAAGALGVFYWGGIWTPTGTESLEENQYKWETFGSGWATRFAADYDPEHVGDSYGGCAWDNQALFDFEGRPLPVIDALRDMAENGVDADGDYTPAEEEVPAEAGENLVINPGFEDGDTSMWQAESLLDNLPFDYQDFVNDAHSGTVAFHYWSESDMHFVIRQTLEGLAPGQYTASVFSQGGDMTNAKLTLFVEADGTRYEAEFMNTRWADWQNPVLEHIPVNGGTLTIGVEIACGARGWGTLDDFCVVYEGN